MSKVTIVTPVYNAAKYLPEVHRAIRAQTYKDWEWILTDDQSKDASWSLLQEYSRQDPRIRVYQNTVNSGPSVSRNNGVDKSTGEYIAFLDADDVWKPEKLETQLSFMKDNGVTFSCHSYEIISESGQILKPVRVPQRVTFRDLDAYNPLGTSFIMVKRSLIGEKRFDVQLKRRQDWVFWRELAKNSPCVSLSESLGFYRKDSAHSISKNKLHMALIQWSMYRSYFGQGLLKSIISFIRYALYGVTKHYLK